MSKDFEIKLPKLGESIVSATIVKIYKKEGDFIQKDESLMEVATDKVNSEIPSPFEGLIKKILVKDGQIVQVGDVIVIIGSKSQKEEKTEKIFHEEKKEEISGKKSFFSPAVMRFAKEHNLKFEDLEKIKGTGEGGRVSKKDILGFLSTMDQKDQSGNFLEITPLRQAIAQNMIKSLKVPHAYLVEDIDVTELMQSIAENKHPFLEKHLTKLTISTYLAKAITTASLKFPLVNSSYIDGKILLKKEINLGLAVNVKNDVVVPVIQNIDKLNFIDIAKHINGLAKKARSNGLAKNDIENGTITLTNFGMTNITIGLPIIKHPEAVIIGAGAIKKRAWVINDQMQIRSILKLSLSFDHRIFDGIYACNFLNEIKKYLEHDFDRSF
ncbi:MAG: Dihydrolipoyllysine-residue acetyltransferase component of pyruvate dehydrogenase complex [Candidatus Anoxychlamydiales bacterium]|nr:Dihydrolipoyllysine-residue acetyltransferase component of pyruvate dehydrogenase complex [Candidatus Anoxychlamydiales bacterium]NGX36212.1 Dihydrolipoyllysine-residue acetyltransferase component of pyruvate dehydrogenase complex [Candidatus Anoxychlamydiales bacterium]